MSGSVTQTTNLFPHLVAEERHRDHQAEEALFLTFNVDLGYFESRLLGLLRATGARVTVVADAGVWAPDTRAVKFAGRSYQLGLVDGRTAFHPKLMVLVGPKRAIAAVGSGNLTMGGWQYNHELLTVFTGDLSGMPTAFGDIRNAVSELAASGLLDVVTQRGLADTSRHLDTLLAAAPPVDTGHRVHASWVSPLITHMPAEPVAELNLFAAFHDPGANAVKNVMTRLQPSRVRVAVQPGWTHVDAIALSTVLSTYSASTGADIALLEDPSSPGSQEARYRHGKLIEWVTSDGQRQAFTGSPNLTTVALLKRAGDGGNYELAVTAPVEQTLFPGGQVIDPAIVPAPVADETDASLESDSQNVQVLSALSKNRQLTVQLNRLAPTRVAVELSSRDDDPDVWHQLGIVPEGARTTTFDTLVPAGSRVRAATAERGPTAPMFVTDELRVRVRSIPEKKASKTYNATSKDLFGDDTELLNLLLDDLTAYAEASRSTRLPAAAADGAESRAAESLDRDTDPIEPWLWLQEDAVRRYGPSLASWLLALPQLAGNETIAVPWADIITAEQAVGLDDDEQADAVDEDLTEDEVEATTSDHVDHSDDVERLKLARRRWANKAVAAAPGQSVHARLLCLRILLVFWTAGNWNDDDPEPFTLTGELIATLEQSETAELSERTASLAAIALTVMKQRTDITVNTEPTMQFNQARAAVRPVLTFATDETINVYVGALRTAYGGTLTVGHVTEALQVLLDPDPLAEAEAEFEAKGYEVHRPAPTWMHIHRSGRNAQLSALEAVAFAQQHSEIGIVVWSTTARGDWACVAWRSPDLVTIFPRGEATFWRHQRLRQLTPGGAAEALRTRAVSDLPDVVNRPRHRRTAEAEAVLSELGLPSWEEPPCCAGQRATSAPSS